MNDNSELYKIITNMDIVFIITNIKKVYTSEVPVIMDI